MAKPSASPHDSGRQLRPATAAATETARYDTLDAIAWYEGNSGGRSHPVKGKSPNPWGLYDMLGNVWDFCWDVVGSTSAELAGCRHCVLRGGQALGPAADVRAAVRAPVGRMIAGVTIGFRPARSVPR